MHIPTHSREFITFAFYMHLIYGMVNAYAGPKVSLMMKIRADKHPRCPCHAILWIRIDDEACAVDRIELPSTLLDE